MLLVDAQRPSICQHTHGDTTANWRLELNQPPAHDKKASSTRVSPNGNTDVIVDQPLLLNGVFMHVSIGNLGVFSDTQACFLIKLLNK